VTGEEWLEQVFMPSLRAGDRSPLELRGALRALADCGVLSKEAVLEALRQLFDYPPLGFEVVASGPGFEEGVAIAWAAQNDQQPKVVRGQEFSVEAIRQRARELNRADREVETTADLRDLGERDHRAWRAAAERFHAACAAMYPGELEDAKRALSQRDATPTEAIETVLLFLEADPWCFRSGYVKQELLRRLAGRQLAGADKERLTPVLLRHVDAGDRRELPRACKLARRHATPQLRAELKRRLASEDPDVARRGLLMLSSLHGPHLSPSELAQARNAILDGIRFGHGGSMTRPDWLQTLARRYWTDAWIDPLVQLAREQRHQLTGTWLTAYAPPAARDQLQAALTRNM
jgi:hypothetical protein